MFKNVIVSIPEVYVKELFTKGELYPTFESNPKTLEARQILKKISGFNEFFLGHLDSTTELTQLFVDDELKKHPENVLLDMHIPASHAFLHSFDIWNDLVYATGIDIDKDLAAECTKSLTTLKDDHVDIQVALDKIDLNWVVGIKKAPFKEL